MSDPPTAKAEDQRAIELSWKALGRKERTVAELRTYLEGKRVSPEAIESAVAELMDGGHLDDARYARRFADDKRSLERWGSDRIDRELHRRGVEAEVVAEVLAGQERESELETAMELLRERFPAPPIDDRGRDRAWRLLVRRGYETELAYEAVRAHARQAAA